MKGTVHPKQFVYVWIVDPTTMTKLLLALQKTEAVAPLTDASVLPGNFQEVSILWTSHKGNTLSSSLS